MEGVVEALNEYYGSCVLLMTISVDVIDTCVSYVICCEKIWDDLFAYLSGSLCSARCVTVL